MRTLRHYRNDCKGNAVVEFALVLPLLLLVLFGITEFGRAIMTKNISSRKIWVRICHVENPNTLCKAYSRSRSITMMIVVEKIERKDTIKPRTTIILTIMVCEATTFRILVSNLAFLIAI